MPEYFQEKRPRNNNQGVGRHFPEIRATVNALTSTRDVRSIRGASIRNGIDSASYRFYRYHPERFYASFFLLFLINEATENHGANRERRVPPVEWTTLQRVPRISYEYLYENHADTRVSLYLTQVPRICV
ncbi:uncharacterized protein LOC143150493 [Ptiloglossa arizonensis]|uniref:uncharacterized protein LOC143150493 n=1 Tax=Ptiloglossa arizonensis TaxID=3350558 RepID=UPI003F9F326F